MRLCVTHVELGNQRFPVSAAVESPRKFRKTMWGDKEGGEGTRGRGRGRERERGTERPAGAPAGGGWQLFPDPHPGRAQSHAEAGPQRHWGPQAGWRPGVNPQTCCGGAHSVFYLFSEPKQFQPDVNPLDSSTERMRIGNRAFFARACLALSL